MLNLMHSITLMYAFMDLLEDGKLDSFPVYTNWYTIIFLIETWKTFLKNGIRFTLTWMQYSQIVCNFIAFENVS